MPHASTADLGRIIARILVYNLPFVMLAAMSLGIMYVLWIASFI